MFTDCDPVTGFHETESDALGTFAWTKGSFETRLRRSRQFAHLHLCYLGERGVLSVRGRRGLIDEVPLCRGWHTAVARLATARAGELIQWVVSPAIPVAGDARELGVMLRRIELSDDARRSAMLAAVQQNLRHNQHEWAAGQMTLASLPPLLRVNLEVRCNIPESGQACTYCAWDWAKLAERGSPSFRAETLDELGAFYRAAAEVNDCSIGEPTMNKDFGAIVAQIDADGKRFSLTTNGQLLSPKRRREMLGRDMLLYVSLEAATAEGYARYRNDRFEEVISNLTDLCREKKLHGDLPKVHVSFIAMRSNADELPQFFQLMAEVGVDEVKLRTLYLDENVDPVTINQGYRYDYARELLGMEELAEVAANARELAQRHGVPLHVESTQFPKDQGAGGPLCSEPWKTLYVLRRGIMPCCYATQPIATWDQQQGRPLDVFLRDVFNGPAYRELRRELAAGRLANYCLKTPSCPILKQKLHEGPAEGLLNAFQRQALAARGDEESPPLPFVPLENLTAHLQNVE